jgi:hypothetical protein
MSQAIIQMFDWRFSHVTWALPRLAALGYSHVHVSPPQRSNEQEWQWWGRYQATGYSLGGPLGSQDDFIRLTRGAAAHGLGVIADVVVCNPCGRRDLMCGVALSDRPAAFRAGFAYLRFLAGLGVRGFRFDAAQAIPPDFFHWALPRLGDALAFGEGVTDRPGDLAPYCAVPRLRMLDFPLLATLRAAFGPGGDLAILRDAAARGGALAGDRAITFVRNHDIERGQADDKGIEDSAYRARFGVGWNEAAWRLDRRAVDLAQACVFARQGGVPYVLCAMRTLPEAARLDRPDDPVVLAGLRFRAHCAALGDPAEDWRIHAPATLAWQRGDAGFAVINAATTACELQGLATSLRAGIHDDLLGGAALLVDGAGRVRRGQVGARQAALFVHRRRSAG